MPYIIAAIHDMGEAQKEIVASVKELKNPILMLSEKMSEKQCAHKENISKKNQPLLRGRVMRKDHPCHSGRCHCHVGERVACF